MDNSFLLLSIIIVCFIFLIKCIVMDDKSNWNIIHILAAKSYQKFNLNLSKYDYFYKYFKGLK